MTEKKTRGRGRPSYGAENMTRRNTYLSDDDWAFAKTLGNGSASEGLRIALAEMKRISVTVTPAE